MQQPEVEQAYFVDNREFKATSAKMLGSGANWDPCGSVRIHGSCHGSCWVRWVHFVLVAARPTLTASATAPRKTWTTRPEPDQVALPSGAAKSLSKVFSLSHLSHLSHLSPQMDNFHHFLHLSSFVISRHLSSSEFSSILRRCRRARRSGAPWSMVSMSAMDGAGGAGRAAMWWCCDALSWSDVGNCWKLLEIVGMIDVKWSRSAQEVLKKVKSQRVNFSKLFKSQYWRCLKSKFDLEESAWR